MSDAVRQLAEEVAALTGEPPPRLFDDDAPVLAGDLDADTEPAYLIGLIGGKDVGKTSLINALVGRELSRPIGHGEGTDRVIAYAHASLRDQLAMLLRSEAGEKFEIVSHDNDRLARQVLLDLPDIDSTFDDHVRLTRRMLRHMLYPVWLQSVEKYADAKPRELLRRVAEGNDSSNFVFVLSKIDQLVDREGPAASEELRDDHAQRLQKALDLPTPPPVYLTSAAKPAEFDLPRLASMLAVQKDGPTVLASRRLAVRRREQTVLAWLDERRLDVRLERFERLRADTLAQLDSRVVTPVLTRSLPAMINDPGRRWTIVDTTSRRRLSRWPILRIFDGLLLPITALLRRNLAPSPSLSADRSATATALQSVFASLHETHAGMSNAMRSRKLWEPVEAQQQADALYARLDAALIRQQSVVSESIGNGRPWATPLRWLSTVGALLWFPVVQPLLEIVLAHNIRTITPELVIWIVRLLGASYLLQSLSFLALYFFGLWMWVRYDTYRRVTSFLRRPAQHSDADPLAEVAAWTASLTASLDAQADEYRRLIARVDRLRESAGQP